MKARDRFHIGDRVRWSAEGRATFPRKKLTEAVVVGFGRRDHLVRVRLIGGGAQSIHCVHMDFLEPAPAVEEG